MIVESVIVRGNKYDLVRDVNILNTSVNDDIVNTILYGIRSYLSCMSRHISKQSNKSFHNGIDKNCIGTFIFSDAETIEFDTSKKMNQQLIKKGIAEYPTYKNQRIYPILVCYDIGVYYSKIKNIDYLVGSYRANYHNYCVDAQTKSLKSLKWLKTEYTDAINSKLTYATLEVYNIIKGVIPTIFENIESFDFNHQEGFTVRTEKKIIKMEDLDKNLLNSIMLVLDLCFRLFRINIKLKDEYGSWYSDIFSKAEGLIIIKNLNECLNIEKLRLLLPKMQFIIN